MLSAAVVGLLIFTAPAHAITVDSLGDGSDADPGNGACNTGANVCTLRAAIQEANAASGGSIDFSVNGTIDIGSELEIRYPVDISGPGPDDLTVRRNPGLTSEFRIFSVNSAIASPIGVSIAGMKITNGLSQVPTAQGAFGFGGGISVSGTVVLTVRDAAIVGNEAKGGALAQGGGIWASGIQGGSIRILDSTIANNKATGLQKPTGAGNEGAGGGLFVDSKSLLVRGSTISGNETSGGSGAPGWSGGNSTGGGIYTAGSYNPKELLVEASTITNNAALNPGLAGGGSGTTPGLSRGGGVYVQSHTATFRNSTLSNNASIAAGGNVYVSNLGTAPAARFISTIVANAQSSANCARRDPSSGNDLALPTTSTLGFNLSDDVSCGFTTADLTNTNPVLGPLADNGGPTLTRAIPATSPAIDLGVRAGTLDFLLGPTITNNNTDQRGFARPNDLAGEPNGTGGDGSDIGAFEFYGEPSSPECSDGVDNDGDDLVDFPADPGCANVDDTDETDQGPVVTCKGKTATLVGTPGANDNLTGGPGRDVIAALDGDDKVNGAGGNDLICGGKGKDKLKGGDGNDDIFGEGGVDRLSGGPGNDELDGGPAKDTCNGGGQRGDRLKSC